jgi:hypothetical protein
MANRLIGAELGKRVRGLAGADRARQSARYNRRRRQTIEPDHAAFFMNLPAPIEMAT